MKHIRLFENFDREESPHDRITAIQNQYQTNQFLRDWHLKLIFPSAEDQKDVEDGILEHPADDEESWTRGVWETGHHASERYPEIVGKEDEFTIIMEELVLQKALDGGDPSPDTYEKLEPIAIKIFREKYKFSKS